MSLALRLVQRRGLDVPGDRYADKDGQSASRKIGPQRQARPTASAVLILARLQSAYPPITRIDSAPLASMSLMCLSLPTVFILRTLQREFR